MAVAITTYNRVLRAVLGDRDPDIPIYDDLALADAVVAIVSLGEVKGFKVSDDGLSIEQDTSTRNCSGYVTDNYQYNYGYAFSYAYGNVYNQWWDQGFHYYLNYVPPAQSVQAGDLTPVGNTDMYATMIWKVAQLITASITSSHFKTRAVSEAIAAPAELVWLIQDKVYNIENGVQSSGRPMPLPVMALGVRSLWSGLWYGGYGLTWGNFGVDIASF